MRPEVPPEQAGRATEHSQVRRRPGAGPPRRTRWTCLGGVTQRGTALRQFTAAPAQHTRCTDAAEVWAVLRAAHSNASRFPRPEAPVDDQRSIPAYRRATAAGGSESANSAPKHSALPGRVAGAGYTNTAENTSLPSQEPARHLGVSGLAPRPRRHAVRVDSPGLAVMAPQQQTHVGVAGRRRRHQNDRRIHGTALVAAHAFDDSRTGDHSRFARNNRPCAAFAGTPEAAGSCYVGAEARASLRLRRGPCAPRPGFRRVAPHGEPRHRAIARREAAHRVG